MRGALLPGTARRRLTVRALRAGATAGAALRSGGGFFPRRSSISCACCAGTAAKAYSGICVSFGWKARMRWAPKRAASRSMRKRISRFAFRSASKSASPASARSARLAQRRMRSKPKPGSSGSASASSFSRNRRSTIFGIADGRSGLDRDAPHDAVGAEECGFETARAFAAFLQDFAQARQPVTSSVARMTSSVATGSAKLRSAR